MSMPPVSCILNFRDGSAFKQIMIPGAFYVPPKILVDGDDYYIRTSDDSIHDPLEFEIVNNVYVIPKT